jgi:hypothetical protein
MLSSALSHFGLARHGLTLAEAGDAGACERSVAALEKSLEVRRGFEARAFSDDLEPEAIERLAGREAGCENRPRVALGCPPYFQEKKLSRSKLPLEEPTVPATVPS